MPFVNSLIESRRAFVSQAASGEVSFAELCRRFNITRPTGYPWFARYAAEGAAGLANRSRRPLRSPRRTAEEVERVVLALRDRKPTWGARKLHRRLETLGVPNLPSPNTVTAILHRHGRIEAAAGAKHRPWQRFEHAAPNWLWQMDYKEHVPLAHGTCQIWTSLDDHSRYAVGLVACPDRRWETVQGCLTAAFRRYGLPDRILCDNGSPWGSDPEHPFTPVTVWLLRLGVDVSHGRPYHPQTQGKEERFHGTLTRDLLSRRTFADQQALQRELDAFAREYNFERPHGALGLATPASRYAPSPRSFPERLPGIEYGPDDVVRKVHDGGRISFQGRTFRVGRGFDGYPVGVRATLEDGVYQVVFCHKPIARISVDEAPVH